MGIDVGSDIVYNTLDGHVHNHTQLTTIKEVNMNAIRRSDGELSTSFSMISDNQRSLAIW